MGGNLRSSRLISRRDTIRRVSYALVCAGLVLPASGIIAGRALASVPTFPENMRLGDASIDERIRRIHATYSIGESLSPSDTEFINLYFPPTRARTSWNFYNSRRFGGNLYELSGSKYLLNTWENEFTFGGTVQGGSPTIASPEITTYYSIAAYEFVGAAYRLCYQDVLSRSSSETMWCTNEYYGKLFGAAQTISCWAEFSTADGSFVVHEA